MENAVYSAAVPGDWEEPMNWLAWTKPGPVERIQITFEDAGSGLLRLQAKMTGLDGIKAEQVRSSGRDLCDSTCGLLQRPPEQGLPVTTPSC